jgi:AcrR family transcriptional regulator
MFSEPYYPIGIQDFSELRRLKAIYVDKTSLIYRLTHRSKYIFLSRPRRFGKSLLTSTLHYYFEGRRELFAGLAMEQLEKEWTAHPVLHFDLSTVKSDDIAEIEEGLSRQIRRYETVYGREEEDTSLSGRMEGLIQRAYAQTGQKVVVLIDEYDAPILEVLHDDRTREKVRLLLRKFYSPLKACDPYLRFVFITGISMFSQLSIFSELNNLEVISRSEDYATLCGITEQELRTYFPYGIEKLGKKLGIAPEEVVAKLKDRYDGYHFGEGVEGVFNPFSLLNAFSKNRLENYWFSSGTPRFLVEMLRRYRGEGKFDVMDLDAEKAVDAGDFEAPLEMQTGPLPLLYQAGYLTIKDYDADADVFFLGIPNSEVRIGLLKNLLPLYADVDNISSVVSRASAALRKGDADGALQLFQGLLASIPFQRGDKELLADIDKTEAYYQRIFYVFFRMLYNEVYAEVRCARGATDVVIFTPRYIYVVEIKINASPDAALRQIEEKGYATPYLADGREVVRLGLRFSTETRTVDEWRRA